MKRFCFAASLMLTAVSLFGDAAVWQLGVKDGSSGEFLAYSNNEFRTSGAIRNSRRYDSVRRSWENLLPLEPAAVPAGISDPGSGNFSTIGEQIFRWQEKEPGWRKLTFRLIVPPDAKNFSSYRISPNENMDIDGSIWSPPLLAVSLPGHRLLLRELPYDLAGWEKKNRKEFLVSVTFPVTAGENALSVADWGGGTYGRCYHFDYLRVDEVSGDDAPPPAAARFAAGKGFANSSVYFCGEPAELTMRLFNLPPEKSSRVEAAVTDYFGKTELMEMDVTADRDGFASVELPLPLEKSGHFRVTAKRDGKLIGATRIAAVRQIPPLTDAEAEASFLGLSGLGGGLYVDPAAGEEQFLREAADYRRWRSLLQIRNERLHSILWHFVERSRGEYDWRFYDALLGEEKKERIHLQTTLLGTPRFLMEENFPGKRFGHPAEIYFAPPPEMARWGEFCRRVAERYGDTIREYDLWNEPSAHSLFWQQGDAAQFLELVKTGSEAIRSVRPEAKIVAEDLWARQEDFVRQLFAGGIARYADIHADHYLSPERAANNTRLVEKYAPGARWISNENKGGQTRNPLGQTDEVSRREAADSLVRDLCRMHFLGAARLYQFVMMGNTWRMWGLVGPDGTPKYTFSVMKTLVNRTAGAEKVRCFTYPGGVELYLFALTSPERIAANGGKYLGVLCNPSGKKCSLRFPAEEEHLRVFDLMDNASELPAPRRIGTVELESSPLFLGGLDGEALSQQEELRIQPGPTDVKPGRPLTLSVLSGSRIRRAELTVNGEPCLLAGEGVKHFSFPTARQDAGTLRVLTVKGTLTLASGRQLPVERSVEYQVDDFAAGENQMPPFSAQNWHAWGCAKIDFAGEELQLTMESDSGTGAAAPRKNFSAIPGAGYLLDFQAEGEGLLYVMLVGFDRKGEKTFVTHGFLQEKLTPGKWRGFRRLWHCPAGTAEVGFNFYQYKEKGHFALRALRWIRLDEDRPVNRQLWNVRRGIFCPVSDDSMLNAPENPVTARFRYFPQGGNLCFEVEVHDRVHQGVAPAGNLYQGDSVQMDFDPGDGRRKQPTVQFGFSLHEGKVQIFRYTVLPSEDIVPEYRIGENPAGVTAEISRDGDVTRYLIRIPPEAVHPQWRPTPGGKIGFSLLVNNNDGQGRTGYLQFSGGIGDGQDSTLFGELTL